MLNVNNQLHGNLSGTGTLSGNGLTQKGDTGNGIDRIEKTGTSGLVDTYTIYYTNGTTETYTVTNGEKGDTGNTGPKGETGEQGPQGIQGIQGVPGEAFSIYKTYASISAMNADKANVPEGKFVLIASTVEDPDNAKLYVKGTTDFTYLTDLSGATGIQGPQGEQGIQGVQGETGPKGDPGDVSTEQMNTAIDEATKTSVQTNTAKTFELTDSANAIASFNKVEGDTYQATRDGKNKLPYNYYDGTSKTINGITYTVDTDGGIIANGTATANATFMLGQNLNIPLNSYKLVGENSSYSDVAVRGSYKQDGTTKYISSSSGNFTLEGIITDFNVYLVILSGKTVDNIKFYPMLLLSTETDLTFERGGVSPSPDYPSDIRNVGDNVNLFDITDTPAYSNNANVEVTGNTLKVSKTSANALCFALYKVLDVTNFVGEKFTLKADWEGSSTVILGLCDNSGGNRRTISSNTMSGNPLTVTIPELSTAKNLAIWFYSENSTDITKYIEYTNIKLEKGSIATPYTPYNCGSIDFNVETKNKFVGWTRNIQTNSNNGIRSTIANSLSSDFCEIKPSTVYRLSGLVTGNYGKNKFIAYYDINKNYISRTGSTNVSSITQTTPANAYYCTVAIAQGFDNATTMENFISDCSQIQLEKGTVITSYQEYGKQEIHFAFAAGQLLHEGDYLADDGIHSIMKTLVIDGTETGNIAYTDENLDGYFLKIGDSQPTPLSYDLKDKCTHFINLGHTPAWGRQINKFALSSDKTLYLLFNKNTFNNFNEFKQWLATQYANGTPVTVEYALATEIVTPYTTEQQEAYYKLKHFLTYEGYTIIECIDNMKPDIQANYLYNNKVNNYYGSVIYALEERLHALEQS